MKRQLLALCLMICAFPLATIAQAETKKGFVITENDQKIEGQLEQSFKKGKLVITSSDNARKTYAASEVKSFNLDGVNYISHSNDFYKEVTAGSKAQLYQKVTDNSGEKIYNGVEIVGYITTTPGKRGDYYLLQSPGASMDLITKKNFRDYFLKLFSNNESLVSKIKDKSLDYDQLKEAVDLYNN
jgi:hypothetical protein